MRGPEPARGNRTMPPPPNTALCREKHIHSWALQLNVQYSTVTQETARGDRKRRHRCMTACVRTHRVCLYRARAVSKAVMVYELQLHRTTVVYACVVSLCSPRDRQTETIHHHRRIGSCRNATCCVLTLCGSWRYS